MSFRMVRTMDQASARTKGRWMPVRAALGAFAMAAACGCGEGGGAPVGDYAVTVQWMKPVKQGKDLVPGPNVVPKAYAEPSSTPLKATVAESENALEPFAITRK